MSASSPVAPTAAPQPNQYSVYLDNSTLVDLVDINGPRYALAQQVLALFNRYKNNGLKVATSFWAITECHSVLYRNELARLSVQRPRRGGRRLDLRNTVPPIQAALAVATQQKNTLLQTLFNDTDFTLLPDADRNALPILQLSMLLAEEAAIFAPDSVHVAIALESGDCQIFITDDQDLLDKLDICQPNVIQPYRQRQYSQLPPPPPFDSYALVNTTCYTGANRSSALQALNALGFS
jgi:predicted nucleic acid-binding protein